MQGRLSEFIGTTMTADWTLTFTDLKPDLNSGYLISWSIDFVSSPCFKTYHWTQLAARYELRIIFYFVLSFVIESYESENDFVAICFILAIITCTFLLFVSSQQCPGQSVCRQVPCVPKQSFRVRRPGWKRRTFARPPPLRHPHEHLDHLASC